MLELDRISPLRPESIRPAGDSDASAQGRRSPLSRSAASATVTQSTRTAQPQSPNQATFSADLSPEAARGEVESRLNELLEQVFNDGSLDRAIRVSRDEESGRFVYKSVDIASGEVVRQFPPEEMLRLVRAVREVAGLILDEDA